MERERSAPRPDEEVLTRSINVTVPLGLHKEFREAAVHESTRGQSYTLHFTKCSSCKKKTDHVGKWGQSINAGIFFKKMY